MGSTNYFNTFIEIADDSPAAGGEVPPQRGADKSVAQMQFEMVADHPYEYTSDEVLFTVYAVRKDLTEAELEEEREKFFAKGQACFRASPLTKRYGWGVHSNEEGKIALYAAESPEYEQFVKDNSVKKTKAMRSKRV